MAERADKLGEFLGLYGGKSILLVAVETREINRYTNYQEDVGRCVQEMLNQLETGVSHGSYCRVSWNSFLGVFTEGDMMEIATHMAAILRQNREELLINRCAIVQTQGSAEELFRRREEMLGEGLSDFIKRDVSGEIQIIEGKILGR